MINLNTNLCDECGTCIAVCYENALIITARLEINPERCHDCGRCAKVCPFGALSIKKVKN
ncbi:4Fe-4S binding protein [bacterium]|nr:4Fe-4S binding protein [bacterium]